MAASSENPFPNTKIADWEFLDSNTTRSTCPKCLKSRKYYCYTCYIPLPHISSKLPKVKLPVKVDIIKHPSELDGKSTSPHAAILAPDDVCIYTYPCIPDYDLEKVILVFPCAESMSLHELSVQYSNEVTVDTTETAVKAQPLSEESLGSNSIETNKEREINRLCKDEFGTQGQGPEKNVESDQSGCETSGDKLQPNCGKRKFEENTDNKHIDESPAKQKKVSPSLPFEKVVFIDSTWNQTKNIINDERLKSLKKVELLSRDTKFWRCQEGIPKCYLSTIEAIYYFMIDLHSIWISSKYESQYDNLLFFFCYMYNKILIGSDGGKGIKAYQR